MEQVILLPYSPLHTVNDSVRRVFYYFLRHPYDLVDARRVMRHLHASPQDIQQAFDLLEQQQTAEAPENRD